MTYVDGFVIAVPTANKDAFIKHASEADSVFLELGATRILECWADDVSHGKQTDFYRAVEAKEDEAVVFSWIEWPDKPTRDAAMGRMEELMKTDPRIFGEIGLISGRRRGATIRAAEDCVVAEVSRTAALKLMASVPAAKRAVTRICPCSAIQAYIALQQ